MILATVLVALSVGGWLVYDNLFASTADEKFSLGVISPSTPKSSAGSKGSDSAGAKDSAGVELAGDWTTAPSSEAGYRVVEDTAAGERTVTGRTSAVTGIVTLTKDSLARTEVSVDLATIASDQALRDKAFRDSIMKTADHPSAIFTQAKPVALASIPASGTPLSVEVSGTLELRGVSRPVVAKLDGVASSAGVTVVGSIAVQLTDFGIDPPTLGSLVTVRGAATIEFKLILTKR